MKRKFISLAGIVVVIVLIVICVKYFRGGNPFAKNGTEYTGDAAITGEEAKNTPAQEGEPDEPSKKLAEQLKSETGVDYDPKNIVSTGKTIVEGKYSYMVDSWEVKKEYPGYALPEGRSSLEEYPGAKLDVNGNITNNYSYVVVNVVFQNLKSKPITELIWGYFKLGIIGSGEEYTGEVTYLGEDVPRKYGHSYCEETVPSKGKKDMALIFVVKDELIEGKQLYLKINSSGVATVNSDYDVRRYIVLN